MVPPFRIPETNLLEREPRTVRVHLTLVRLRPHRRRHAPGDGHPEELPKLRRVRLASRPEEHVPVGRPPLNHVGTRVPGESFGLPAHRRDHEHVGIAAVLPAERNPAPVRAEVGIGLRALRAREANRVSTVPVDDPHVVCVHERDVRGVDVGLSEESRTLGLDNLCRDGQCSRRQRRGKQEERETTSLRYERPGRHGRAPESGGLGNSTGGRRVGERAGDGYADRVSTPSVEMLSRELSKSRAGPLREPPKNHFCALLDPMARRINFMDRGVLATEV